MASAVQGDGLARDGDGLGEVRHVALQGDRLAVGGRGEGLGERRVARVAHPGRGVGCGRGLRGRLCGRGLRRGLGGGG